MASDLSLENVTLEETANESEIVTVIPGINELRNATKTTIEQGIERCVLEDFTKCSKSHLWKLMMSYYDRRGPSAWSNNVVPNFITCNSYIAKCYAKALHGYIADSLRGNAKLPLDKSEPFYIIELGVGSAKFSFLMLKALKEMKAVCDFPFEKIVYVMTDFTESNFNFWLQHESLKPFFDEGVLDAAIFDGSNDSTIKLWRSGITLGPGSTKNPICVVANYLFDTLCHDIFQVNEKGVLMEGLVSTGSKNSTEPDPLAPEIIQRLDNRYQYNPITNTAGYFSDEEEDTAVLGQILDWYEDYFGNTNLANGHSGGSILIPIGALRALRRISRMSSGRLVVISGDKGINNPEQFIGMMDPHIAVHGSFSLMVNYHAVGLYFTLKGGFTMNSLQDESSLKVGCFVLTGDQRGTANVKDYLMEKVYDIDEQRQESFPHLKQAFNDYIGGFGPGDFFAMQKAINEDMERTNLRTVVALLKCSEYDTDVFFKMKDHILKQISSSDKMKNDILRCIPKIWSNYFLLDMEKDIAFEIGRVFYGCREYRPALKYYLISLNTIGEHQVTRHNIGLCYYSIGEISEALKNFERAVELNEHYEKARNWRDKARAELRAIAEKKARELEHQAERAVMAESAAVEPMYELDDGAATPNLMLNSSSVLLKHNEGSVLSESAAYVDDFEISNSVSE